MTGVKYCPNCRQNVTTEHSWSTPVLILLLLFFAIIGIIYLLVNLHDRCPTCHTKEDYLLPPLVYMPPAAFGPPAAPVAPPQAMQSGTHASAQVFPCPACGNPLNWIAQHQRWFCPAEQQYR